MNVNSVECDVLIVGGGLTALRAAVEARQAGASVIVVCKRKVGRSGSSAFTAGGYAAAVENGDRWGLHFLDTWIGGARIGSTALVRVLCHEAAVRLNELEKNGIRFQKTQNRYRVFSSGDHNRARIAMPARSGGTRVTLPLRDWAERQGCAFLENIVVTDLLNDGDRVVGAVGLHRKEGSVWSVQAGATILATGGAGQIFSVTSNPPDVTGDGYALALRSGARLRDMEFIQFYPWRMLHPFPKPRFSIQANTWVAGARLYNAAGERFMARYDPVRKEATTRDIAARGIFEQIRDGHDIKSGVRVDISSLSDEKWRYINPRLAAQFMRHHVDPRGADLIVAPEAHFMSGGVVIDAFGRSELPGLYAAGEVAGGVHGGNRIDSNALPETQVFGARAGRAAASAVVGSKARHKTFDPHRLVKLQKRLSTVTSQRKGYGLSERKARLTEFRFWSDKSLGIIRNAPSLRRAIKSIINIKENSTALSCRNLQELLDSFELENLCLTTEASLQSALLRTESRGAHFREDYPDLNPAWALSIMSRLDSGEVCTETGA